MRMRWMALAIAVSACGGPRILMRTAASHDVPAPAPGQARVVLALPGSYRDVAGLVDERGRYLGQLGSRTFTTVEVAPGAHRFYALTGASEFVVGGEVEAGRTYWIVAETGLMHRFAWRAWTPSCDESAERLEESRAVEPDPDADQAAIDRQLGDIPRRIENADRELSAMTEALRAERTLAPAPLCGDQAVPAADPTPPAEAAPAAPAEAVPAPATSGT